MASVIRIEDLTDHNFDVTDWLALPISLRRKIVAQLENFQFVKDLGYKREKTVQRNSATPPAGL